MRYLLLIYLFVLCWEGLSQTKKVQIDDTLRRFEDSESKILFLLKALDESKLSTPDSSVYYAKEAYRLAQEQKNIDLEIRALLLLAKYLSIPKPRNAYKYYLKASQIAKRSNKPRLLAKVFNEIAKYYIYFGQYQKASNYIKQEIIILEKLKITPVKAYALKAKLYAKQHNLEKAITYYQKNLKVQLKEDLEEAASTYSEMGNAYYQAKNYTKARAAYLKGIETARNLKKPQIFGFLYDNVGLSYYREKEYTKALTWQISALKNRRKVGELLGVATSLNNLSQTYLSLQQYEKALKLAQESYLLVKDLKQSYPLPRETCEILADIYEALEKPNKAFFFMKKAYYFQGKINEQKQQQAINSAILELDITQHKLENERLSAKNQRLFLVQIFLLIFTLLAGIIIFIINRQNVTRKKLLKDLEHANHNKDKLFSIIAHDLKSPINSVRALLDLLAEGLISKQEMTQLSDKLRHNTSQVSLLLNNLLLWAKSQFQGLETYIEPIKLQMFINEQVNLLNTLAEHKDVQVTTSDNIADTQILADPDQLSLIIRNLLNNALKFTNKGGQVHISSMLDSEKPQVIVQVKDNGVGIPSDKLSNLFQPNQQYSTRGTNNEKGTGLGLLLVKEMIDNNSGSIWVESQENIGTSFYFSLPLTNQKVETSSVI